MSQGSRGEADIRTPDRRLRVFVSSTLGELAEERRAVSRAISALRLTPVMFEAGARPYPPAEVYRSYLAQSDVFVGVYWQRYGQIVPDTQVSGLEEEFDLSGGLPRLLYIKAPAPNLEPRLADLLSRFEEEASASYRHFRTPAELGRLVRDDLAVLLSERFGAGGGQAAALVAARRPRSLPVSMTSLLGRERAIDEVADLVERFGARLVTLTGPGGVGKTRLAVAVGERLGVRFGAGTVFVPLEAITNPQLALAAIGRMAGANLTGTGSRLGALAEMFGDGAWLLILDNLEQVHEVTRDIGELLARCPRMTIVATSRTVLELRAEREYPVPPLPLPASVSAGVPAAEAAASPAVALFVDRARAVRPGFALTEDNAEAVAGICRRLEGLPLAIELAAARTRLLDPAELLGRLARSLDALGTGPVDLPERQQTLRATVEWSVGLLQDAERSLLEVAAVFVDGWTIGAAAQVAGLGEDRALDLSEELARHSLIYVDITGLGPRSRMLETIRAFVAERLAARPDAGEVRRRHADYYQTLAEQADRPLRGDGQSEWLKRLQAESGNLAAAVDWYLARDSGPLPHLFRVLWPFWFLRDHIPESRSWILQLLPAAESLDAQAHAELASTALTVALEVGDDETALATARRLGPLLPGIKDPVLRAVSQLAMAWSAPIAGDFDGALRVATESLEQLRGLDEPFWTALAVGSVATLENVLGRYEDALGHLREARNLGDRLGNTWLAAWSQVHLGTLSILQGDLRQARTLLNEALELSLAASITSGVTLCLAAYARLALAEGDPGRAALLAGAVEELRRRPGLRVWPTLRRAEAEMVAEIRQALGAEQFDQAFSTGARLTQRDAVAIVQDQRGPSTQAS